MNDYTLEHNGYSDVPYAGESMMYPNPAMEETVYGVSEAGVQQPLYRQAPAAYGGPAPLYRMSEYEVAPRVYRQVPARYGGGPLAGGGPVGPAVYEKYSSGTESVDMSERVKSRCDQLSVILMIGCVVGLFYMLVSSSFEGRIAALSHPLNYHGYACGWDGPVSHLPYVYYPLDPKDGSRLQLLTERPMCVERCPGEEDVAKKAYISISDARAVNVGKSLALVSLLHSVRSPLYATEANSGGYCVPKAGVLRSQLQARVTRATWLRSVASTIVHTAPVCAAAAVVGCVLSYILGVGLVSNPRLFGSNSYLLAAGLLGTHGLRVLLTYPRTQMLPALLCLGATAGLLSTHQVARLRIGRAERLLEGLADMLETRRKEAEMYVTAAQLLLLGVAYSVITAFCFSQTALDTSQAPMIDFTLDPNGGLRIQPLETVARFADRRAFFKLLLLAACGLSIMDCAVTAFRAVCMAVVKHSQLPPATDRSSESGCGRPSCRGAGCEDCAAVQAGAAGLAPAPELGGTELWLGAVQEVCDRVGSVWAVAAVQRATGVCGWVADILAPASPFAEAMDRWNYEGNLVEFAFDSDTSFTRAVQKADAVAATAAAQQSPILALLGTARWATRGAALLVFAAVFVPTHTLMLLLCDLDGGALAPAAQTPLTASAAVAALTAYVARLRLRGLDATADAALYLAELRQCPLAQDEVLHAVRQAADFD
ncbi:putative transmembrane protein [Gregarina niphandrodes]|uniref:Transmembrane protein n=1 Tax=Gregarina niphandrodes TaxID=110365 RepID=A0A023BAF5_GRENI|nr:putative transmembrane protein [Gregarina niphandrodes]EZG78263.1 putative transmembrane protein [Gregarina niphandrodes]|eukprot:XP_011129368.1 putative transmembrane protein [Gregarina niphandrodes]